MKAEIAHRLLAINREFYAAVGAEFDATRQNLPAGMVRLLEHAPDATPLRVLDMGCGNGRFARALQQMRRPVEYTGMDADPWLLAAARSQTADLADVQCHFVQADLADAGWSTALAGPFDFIVCVATLHHLPDDTLRVRIFADMARLATPTGRVAAGLWRFSLSARLASRTVAWSAVGLAENDVDPGDALLPWDQGVHALRYVHEISAEELQRYANAAGLRIVTTYAADGKEGNLNLYAILKIQTTQNEEHHIL